MLWGCKGLGWRRLSLAAVCLALATVHLGLGPAASNEADASAPEAWLVWTLDGTWRAGETMSFAFQATDDSGSVQLRTLSFTGPDGVRHDVSAGWSDETSLIKVPTDTTWALGEYEIQSVSAEDGSGNRSTYHRDGTVEYSPHSAGDGRPATHNLNFDLHGDFTLALPPDAPTNVVAEVSGDRVIAVSFTEPNANGDRLSGVSAVTDPEGYQTIGGYSNPVYARFDRDMVGKTFTFTVQVSNGAGGSTPVTSNPVTVTGLPAPPDDVTASAGDRSATVSWHPREPGWGQSPAESYTVRTLPSGGLVSVDATATQATVPGLTPGVPYQFEVAATNAAGEARNWTPTNEVTPYGDVEGPVTRITGGPRGITTNTSVVLAWEATDDSGVAAYDVRRRAARYDAGFGSWVRVRSGTTDERSRFHAASARKHCLQVRARDSWGNVGPWSAERCFVTPIDDRQLAAGGWARWRERGNFQGTLTSTRAAGRRLVLDGVRARSLRLLVQRCRACGKVRVYYRGVPLGTFDLSASGTRKKSTVVVRRFDRLMSGRLVVLSATAGKPVRIDGVIAWR